jgi:hypothetical protein
MDEKGKNKTEDKLCTGSIITDHVVINEEAVKIEKVKEILKLNKLYVGHIRESVRILTDVLQVECECRKIN